MKDIHFAYSRVWTGDLWISSPALYHNVTPSNFQVLNSCRGIGGGIVLIGPLRFSISGIELSTLCRGIGGGGIVLIGPVTDFLFAHTRVWTGYLWISSPALYHCATVTSGFHLWQFQVLKSGAEGLVVVLFWLDLWEIFFLPTPGFELGTSGSLVLHSTTVPQWLLVFTSDNFRYWTLVQRRLVVVLFWLDLWEIFFLPTPGFELGTSGSLVLHVYHGDKVTSGFHLWQFQVFEP